MTKRYSFRISNLTDETVTNLLAVVRDYLPGAELTDYDGVARKIRSDVSPAPVAKAAPKPTGAPPEFTPEQLQAERVRVLTDNRAQDQLYRRYEGKYNVHIRTIQEWVRTDHPEWLPRSSNGFCWKLKQIGMAISQGGMHSGLWGFPARSKVFDVEMPEPKAEAPAKPAEPNFQLIDETEDGLQEARSSAYPKWGNQGRE